MSTHVEFFKHAIMLRIRRSAAQLRHVQAFGHSAVRSARSARAAARREIRGARAEPGRGYIVKLTKAPKCVWRCAFCGAEPMFKLAREGMLCDNEDGPTYRTTNHDLVDAVCPRGSCTEHDTAPLLLRWRHVDERGYYTRCGHDLFCMHDRLEESAPADGYP